MHRISFLTKGFTKINKRFRFLQILIVFTVLITTGVVSMASYSTGINQDLADHLLRFHVIANSDSPEDQELKRAIRDAVIREMPEMLKESKSVEQTKSIIIQNMDQIEKIALEKIKEYKKDYQAKVMLGNFLFPTKTYGSVILPAGEYQALRIVVGKGEGANWWCVLFPPLCFVDATHGTIPDSVKEDLKSVLTNEEYSIITSAENTEEIPIRVKFKIVEFFEQSKGKLTSTFANIFKKVQ